MNINKKKNQIKYSQNFLRSEKLVKKIINKSNITSADLVLEIGPGRGIITEELVKRCQKVIAIEKDKKLYQFLKDKFKEKKKVEVVLADISVYSLPNSKYKIFANIPFNITAEVIKKITIGKNFLQDAYLIIQKEAAKKFVGFPYSRRTQMYALLLKPWFDIKIVYLFKKTDFKPIPHVNTVLINIKKVQKPLIKKEQEKLYRDFIVYAFTHWEATVKNNLSSIFTYQQFKQLSRDFKFNIKAMLTELSFNQWLGLFNYFSIDIDKNKQILIYGAEENLRTQQKRLQKIHRTANLR